MKFSIVIPYIISLFFFNSEFARAASLQMYPLTINFCNDESVKPVFVKNTGDESVGAQFRLYKWDQKNRNDILTPTEKIIISPPITTIPPGKEQLVRIISSKPVSFYNDKGSFRLLIDELPGEKQKTSQDKVSFLLRYSVPVFFECDDLKPDLNNISIHIDNNELVIYNHGRTHLKLSNVRVNKDNDNYLLTKGLLGYVLPGSEMSWVLPPNISRVTSVTAIINDHAISQTISINN